MIDRLPDTLVLNAFTGDDVEVAGSLADDARKWGSKEAGLDRQAPLPAEPANPADWRDPLVGWGIVLPENDALSEADRANGVDAPDPIRDLLTDRPDAAVLRYRPDLKETHLAHYLRAGGRQDPLIGLTPYGLGPGRLPLYLLIVGGPAEVPWKLQYSLNRRHHVGRLALDDDGLANYVNALRNDWNGIDCDPGRPVVWSTNYDTMTMKMDATIASQLAGAIGGDAELGALTRITGDAATLRALIDALAATQPAVIATSSHGKTGPLDDADAMRASLGLPVDVNRATLDADELLGRWSPSGSIWYAQACCSAGSDAGTSYEGLLSAGSLADQVTRAVGALGPTVAPLPTRLLGAAQPARAFIGHVEPTFDWTLLAQETGQFLTPPLVDAIYPNVFRRCPVGISFDAYYRGVGELYAKLEEARKRINDLDLAARDAATYYRLTARDRESLVLLGDPTVTMPPLPSQVGKPHPPERCNA